MWMRDGEECTFKDDDLGTMTVTKGEWPHKPRYYFELRQIAKILDADNEKILATCRNLIFTGYNTIPPMPRKIPDDYIIGLKDVHRLANACNGKRAYALRAWLRALGIRRLCCWPDKKK